MAGFHEQQIAGFHAINARAGEEQATTDGLASECTTVASLVDAVVAEVANATPDQLRLFTLAKDVHLATARMKVHAENLSTLHARQRKNMEAFVANAIAHHVKNRSDEVPTMLPSGCVPFCMTNETVPRSREAT